MDEPDDPDPAAANVLPQFILIAALTFVNAFFAASEMALVSINKNKVKMMVEDGNKRAAKLEKLLAQPDKFLSTIQVLITFAGFFSSASAATALSDRVGGFLARIGIPASISETAAVVLITFVLIFFNLVLGELYPKRLAMQKAEKFALAAVGVISAMQALFYPFVKLLSASTNGLLRLTGLKVEAMEESISKEEFKSMVETGQETGVLNETESDILTSVFEFEHKTAVNVMTPRTDVYMINLARPLSEYLDEMLHERYSRIPVYEDDVDNIVGILYMKDFLVEARRVGFDHVNIANILHPAYFVPERKPIDELLVELRETKTHMAILIDEYGGFSGIVTMEDLIEEIVGDIEDEFDADEPEIRKIDETTYQVSGLVTINDLNDELDLELDGKAEDYDTLGGLILHLLGHIPTEEDCGTELEHEGLLIKIEAVKDKRVELVKLVIPPVPKEEKEERKERKEKDKDKEKEKAKD